MKKYFVLIGIMLLCTGMIFAGGSTESEKSEVLWLYEAATPEQEEVLRTSLIDVVNSNTEDYQITIRFDANYDQNLRTSMLAGAGPDLVQTAGPSYVQEFAMADYLLPLDEYAAAYGWDKTVFPVMQDLCTINGKLYALPKTYESMVLFYNKTLFEENDWEQPKTWEDFEKLSEEIKAAGFWPMVNGNASWKPVTEHLITIFYNHLVGPEKLQMALEGKKRWTDPEFVYATERLKHFFDEYFDPNYFSYTDEDCLSVLAAGEAAFYPSGTWNFQNIDEYFEETGQEWDWFPIPSAEGVPYPLYELGIGATLSINAKSSNPDAVAEVINTLYSDKDVIVNLNAGWPGEWNIPVNTISRSDFGDRIDERYAHCLDEIGNAVNAGNYGFTTWTFWPEQTNKYLWEEFEKVILDTLSVEDYLEQMDILFQEELKAGRVPKLPQQ